jgi:ribosomal protein L16/L10AE
MAENFKPPLKKLLREAGCRFERQGKGDHEIWYSLVTKRRFMVDARIKSRHWANRTLKQAAC